MVHISKTGRVTSGPKIQWLPPRPGGEVERALQERFVKSLERGPVIDADYGALELRAQAALSEQPSGFMAWVFQKLFRRKR